LPCGENLLTLLTGGFLINVTPMRPAIYTTLMTIRDADVAAPIALIRIGTVIAAVGVPVSAVISTAICTSIMSAVDASNATGR
jgi:hypothetical protein